MAVCDKKVYAFQMLRSDFLHIFYVKPKKRVVTTVLFIYPNHNPFLWLATKRKNPFDIFENRCLFKFFYSSQMFTHPPRNLKLWCKLNLKLFVADPWNKHCRSKCQAGIIGFFLNFKIQGNFFPVSEIWTFSSTGRLEKFFLDGLSLKWH